MGGGTALAKMEQAMMFRYRKINTPVGALYAVAENDTLRGAMFESIWKKWEKLFPGAEKKDAPVLRETARQLAEYFQGRRRAFDLPFALGGTPFQKRAWTALAAIPYGQTRTYKEQAAAARVPNAVRAVGRTNGVNPLCVILPCHRVVGSDGSLTGYAGGLAAKRFLLSLEGVAIKNDMLYAARARSPAL